MIVYSDSTAAEAILNGLDELRRARDERDHYRSGPAPAYVEERLRKAIHTVGEGLRYALDAYDDSASR